MAENGDETQSPNLRLLDVHTERLFVRINHKNELYFSIISFHDEANRVYLSEINIVLFKRQS